MRSTSRAAASTRRSSSTSRGPIGRGRSRARARDRRRTVNPVQIGLLAGACLWLLVAAAPAAAQSCPGTGECCSANATAGCSEAGCCQTVCNLDPFCCLASWDDNCASLANSVCAFCSSGVCPGPGDCCIDNGSPGCDDTSCCQQICAQDSLCCGNSWDQNCADLALSECGSAAARGATCVGLGDCCEANGSTSCEEESCCNLVCAQDAFCCDTLWDANCATLADGLCNVCSGPAIPATSRGPRLLLVITLAFAGISLGSASLMRRVPRGDQRDNRS